MNFHSAKQEFEVRYYKWALQDFRREIEQDFPFLRHFRSGSAKHIVTIMSSMKEDARIKLATALIKRFHSEALVTTGDQMNSDEARMCESFLDHSCYLDQQELHTQEKEKRFGRNTSYEREALYRDLKDKLQSAGMATFIQESLPGVLSYINNIQRWQIITRVHTRDRDATLSYEHSIWSIDKVDSVALSEKQHEMWPAKLHDFISISAWLGISSQTKWYSLRNDERNEVAKQLVTLFTHFLDAAPDLLRGLFV